MPVGEEHINAIRQQAQLHELLIRVFANGKAVHFMKHSIDVMYLLWKVQAFPNRQCICSAFSCCWEHAGVLGWGRAADVLSMPRDLPCRVCGRRHGGE